MLILESVGINPNICFKYDDIYFPYIVVWYSTIQHKSFYQLFYDKVSALHFYNILQRKYNKSVALFEWNTSELSYVITYI